MNTQLGVSVVVPTAQPRFLRECLDGLARQLDPRFEVIVVENGPADPRVAADVAKLGATIEARYVHLGEAGLNRARNRGCRAARYELLALLDDDCIPALDWIGRIIEHHQGFPDAGIIGGRVELQFLATPPAWLAGEFLLNLCGVHWSDQARELDEKEFIVGANMSVRREVFERVGGFNEEFGLKGRGSPQLANDETLFNHEAERSGFARILYSPGIVVYHQIPPERLQFEYHEQRRYGQGVSDIDLAVCENADGPLSGYEKFRLVVQHQQWHRDDMIEAGKTLGVQDAKAFRSKLVLTRIAYLCGAQDRILHRFEPGSLNAPLSIDELRPYDTGRRAAARLRASPARDGPSDVLEGLVYRGRPRSLEVREFFHRCILHLRVAFLRGFKDEIRGVDSPSLERKRIQELETIGDHSAHDRQKN